MSPSKRLLLIGGLAAAALLAFLFINRKDTPGEINTTPNYQSETSITESTVAGQLEPNTIKVGLSPAKESSEAGTAILKEIDGKVVVTLSTQNFPLDIPQPAHIHTGVCPDVGAVKYPLTNLINGKSQTTLNVTLDQLRKMEPIAINVHKSVPESKTYVSCGDIM